VKDQASLWQGQGSSSYATFTNQSFYATVAPASQSGACSLPQYNVTKDLGLQTTSSDYYSDEVGREEAQAHIWLGCSSLQAGYSSPPHAYMPSSLTSACSTQHYQPFGNWISATPAGGHLQLSTSAQVHHSLPCQPSGQLWLPCDRVQQAHQCNSSLNHSGTT
jgi:hypothetical protein